MQLELYLSLCVVSALAVIGAECRNLPVADQHELANNSTPCSLEVTTICTATQESDLYSLHLDKDHYSETGEIRGNLFITASLSYSLLIIKLPAAGLKTKQIMQFWAYTASCIVCKQHYLGTM